MPDVARPGSLGREEAANPRTPEALTTADALRDKDVRDVAGERVGRIVECFLANGELSEIEVRLDRSLASALGVEARTARIAPSAIAEVGLTDVRLKVPARQALALEDARPATRGSEDPPRKVR
jgi:hypothetical protein